MRKHQGHSKVLFLQRRQTCTKDLLKHPRLLGAVLGLEGEGGSTVAMKGGGGVIWGLRAASQTASTLLCCQILLHDMKLKYQSGLAVEWFDLSVELSNQQFIATARLSACDKTCDECLSCQL